MKLRVCSLASVYERHYCLRSVKGLVNTHVNIFLGGVNRTERKLPRPWYCLAQCSCITETHQLSRKYPCFPQDRRSCLTQPRITAIATMKSFREANSESPTGASHVVHCTASLPVLSMLQYIIDSLEFLFISRWKIKGTPNATYLCTVFHNTYVMTRWLCLWTMVGITVDLERLVVDTCYSNVWN